MNFNKEIIVNDKLSIGGNNQTFIIAEACDNHMGRMDYALKMVDIAILCGANAIKFQHHLPDEEMLPDVPMSDNFKEPLYEILKKFSLTLDQHKELKSYCDQKGILYMCTPFSLKAATEIEDLVDLYKIGSGECTDTPTLIEIAKKGKPMIISTGMATIDEIEYTLQTLHPYNQNIMIMNCTSEYPPNYEDINVKLIPKLSEKFNIIVGHSDHTPDNYTCFAAVSHGAKLIEKHIILDKSHPGPDQNVSIDPIGLHDLVDGIRKVEKSLGENKEIHNLEKPIKEWARRSVVTIKDIKQGEEFTLENLWTKRPGTGIPARELFNILGNKASNDIKNNQLLSIDSINNFKLKNEKNLSKKNKLYLGSGIWEKENWYNHHTSNSMWYNNLTKKKISKNFGDAKLLTNFKFDFDLDLTKQIKFPIKDNNLKVVYSSHMIEHLRNQDVEFLFKDVYRMLEVDGIFRITCPDVDILYNELIFKKNNINIGTFSEHLDIYEKFLHQIASYFGGWYLSDFDLVDTNIYDEFLKLKKYNNNELNNLFEKYGKYGTFEFFRNECEKYFSKFKNHLTGLHINWWNKDKVVSFLINAGFTKIFIKKQNISIHEEFKDSIFDYNNAHNSLFIEAIK